MEHKYNPDIHKRHSIRLKGYDYSKSGLYFITICTHNRENLFGEILDGEMQLNEIGKIIEKEWLKSAKIRKEIEIYEFVVMPNHFHAIAEIVETSNIHQNNLIVGAYGIRPNNIIDDNKLVDIGDLKVNEDLKEIEDLKGVCHTPLRSPSRTVGALVRGFKSAVTKAVGFSPWQRNYHEHIIRNEKSYIKISEYIKNNPLLWEIDSLNPKTNQ